VIWSSLMPVKTLFISHIGDEAPVAEALKEFLERVFGPDFAFVSSDYESLRGGEDWYPAIVQALKECRILIALVSRQSVEARWINFEAGVSIGAHDSTPVIPVTFRGYGPGEIGHPLSPKMGRNLEDTRGVEALVRDISKHTGAEMIWKAEPQDLVEFVERVKILEKRLRYFGIEMCPDVHGSSITFEIENTGNVPIELHEVEVVIPRSVMPPYMPSPDTNVLERKVEMRNERQYVVQRLKVYGGTLHAHLGISPLPPSLPPRRKQSLNAVGFTLPTALSEEQMDQEIAFSVWTKYGEVKNTRSVRELLQMGQR